MASSATVAYEEAPKQTGKLDRWAVVVQPEDRPPSLLASATRSRPYVDTTVQAPMEQFAIVVPPEERPPAAPAAAPYNDNKRQAELSEFFR